MSSLWNQFLCWWFFHHNMQPIGPIGKHGDMMYQCLFCTRTIVTHRQTGTWN